MGQEENSDFQKGSISSQFVEEGSKDLWRLEDYQTLFFQKEYRVFQKEYRGGIVGEGLVFGFPDIERLRVFLKQSIRGNDRETQSSKEMHRLQAASDIIFNTIQGIGGIGDSIISARYAKLMAREFPDRRLHVVLHPALLNIRSFDFPINVSLFSTIPQVLLPQSGPFFFAVDLENLPKDVAGNIKADARCSENPKFNQRLLYRAQKDVFLAAWLLSLGLQLKQSDLEVAIFKEPENFPKTQFDFLLAPDALEFSDQGKSKKSLPVSVWSSVFDNLKVRGLEGLAVLQGTAHPGYCQEVAKVAQGSGIKVETVVTPTLNDLVAVLHKSRIFIGMDSGTTHLAAEVARVNSKLSLRQLFLSDGNIYRPEKFGISGLQQRGKILSFVQSKNRKDEEFPQAAELLDTDGDIAKFILS